MKTLTLMNARRHRKKSGRRRRRNPFGSSAAYRSGYARIAGMGGHSPRKRTHRRRRASGIIIRSLHGKRRKAVRVSARRIYVSHPTKNRALVVAQNPYRRRRNPFRRRSRGGFRLLNPLIPGGLMGQVKSAFSKDMLVTAAGGVAAAAVTNYLTSLTTSEGTKFVLPRPADPNSAQYKATVLAYTAGIPIAAAMLTRKYSPAAARGMVIGGLINTGLKAWKLFEPNSYARVIGTGEYLDAVGAYTPSFNASSNYARAHSVNGALDNSSAFASSAW